MEQKHTHKIQLSWDKFGNSEILDSPLEFTFFNKQFWANRNHIITQKSSVLWCCFFSMTFSKKIVNFYEIQENLPGQGNQPSQSAQAKGYFQDSRLSVLKPGTPREKSRLVGQTSLGLHYNSVWYLQLINFFSLLLPTTQPLHKMGMDRVKES